MPRILDKLRGGNLRSIGRAGEVVSEVLADLNLFGEVFEGMLHRDPVVRMRSADVIEKVTAQQPEVLLPYIRRLLHDVAQVSQQEVRWHVALMIGRVPLDARERLLAFAILQEYLGDKSSIVRTFAMQGLADLAAAYPRLRARIIPMLIGLTENGTPAMRSRGKKLLARLHATKKL